MISSRKKEAKVREGWRKPLEGKIVINVDAAFDENSGTGATGVIIKDDHGTCLGQPTRNLIM
jgi:D-aminopeptidase